VLLKDAPLLSIEYKKQNALEKIILTLLAICGKNLGNTKILDMVRVNVFAPNFQLKEDFIKNGSVTLFNYRKIESATFRNVTLYEDKVVIIERILSGTLTSREAVISYIKHYLSNCDVITKVLQAVPSAELDTVRRKLESVISAIPENQSSTEFIERITAKLPKLKSFTDTSLNKIFSKKTKDVGGRPKHAINEENVIEISIIRPLLKSVYQDKFMTQPKVALN
jgi:hypothetical protein